MANKASFVFRTPLLLLLLAFFAALLALTVWTSETDIHGFIPGVPRTIEPAQQQRDGKDIHGGVRDWLRDFRFAASTIAIIAVLLAAAVFLLPLKPVGRTGANTFIAVLLIIAALLAIIAFAYEVNQEFDAVHCTTNPHQSQFCESKEDVYTAVVVFTALLFVALLVSAILLVNYSRSGDWTRAHDPKLLVYGETGQMQPGMYPNGVSFVRKWILTIALVSVFVLAALVLVGSIMLWEYRETWTIRDANNRALSSGVSTRPGWPNKNVILRYFLCAAALLTIVLNLIPIRSTTLHYIFGFLYFILAVLCFVAFAVDLDSLNDADDIECPATFSCENHKFAAIVALEFLAGVLLLLYVCCECGLMHKKKKAPREAPVAEPTVIHVPVPVPVQVPVPVSTVASQPVFQAPLAQPAVLAQPSFSQPIFA